MLGICKPKTSHSKYADAVSESLDLSASESCFVAGESCVAETIESCGDDHDTVVCCEGSCDDASDGPLNTAVCLGEGETQERC